MTEKTSEFVKLSKEDKKGGVQDVKPKIYLDPQNPKCRGTVNIPTH